MTPSSPHVCRQPALPGAGGGGGASRRLAFTLIELMVVVGIMGILLTTGVPLVYRIAHKEPMRQSVSELVKVCSYARAQAILKGAPVELVFHPREKVAEVAGAGGATVQAASGGSTLMSMPTFLAQERSARIHEDVIIEMLDINLLEYKDEEIARVRFYPNGTCDELTVILQSRGEWKKISLEVTTALAQVGNVR